MIDPRGLEIIKRFEGFRPTTYLCPAGIPTIGYGSTRWVDGGPVPPGVKVTTVEAERLLARDVAADELRVRRLAKSASEAQIAALVSFAYNLGVTALAGSTLLRKHNAGDYGSAAAQFARWNKAGGRVLPGLVARREAERRLYLTPG